MDDRKAIRLVQISHQQSRKVFLWETFGQTCVVVAVVVVVVVEEEEEEEEEQQQQQQQQQQ